MYGNLDPEQGRNTYAAVVSGFGPASNATDIISLFGDGTKLVRVKRIRMSGIATAVSTMLAQAVKRSTLNSSGTPTAATVVPYRSSQTATVVTVNSYGANPTTGTLIGAFRTFQVTLSKASNPGAAVSLLELDFTADGREVFIEGTESLCINLGGVSAPSGAALEFDFTWTEEPKT